MMPDADLLQRACVVAYAAVLIVAAWRDWRTLQIADGFPLAIVGVYGVWAVGGLASERTSLAEVGIAVAIALVLLIVGATAFALGVLGGGDAKLLAAAALFAGPMHLMAFLLALALAGGALSLAALLGAGMRTPSGDDDGHRRLPYAPAVAAGGLVVALARMTA